VDFFWINREQRSFEWFVNLLSQLEAEQAEKSGVMDRFLDMHMYITSGLQRTDLKAVGLQMALDLLYDKVKLKILFKKKLELRGIEPRAFHMQSERSTTELQPPCINRNTGI
jgi:hypothetical protein